MSKFEKIYHIDPSRESNQDRELHPSIELSDEMMAARYVSKKSPKVEEMSPSYLQHERMLIENMIKTCEIITLTKEHKGDQNEKSKSKSPKKKPKKANTKPNKSAMASLQKKL